MMISFLTCFLHVSEALVEQMKWKMKVAQTHPLSLLYFQNHPHTSLRLNKSPSKISTPQNSKDSKSKNSLEKFWWIDKRSSHPKFWWLQTNYLLQLDDICAKITQSSSWGQRIAVARRSVFTGSRRLLVFSSTSSSRVKWRVWKQLVLPGRLTLSS